MHCCRSTTYVPPTSRRVLTSGIEAKNGSATLCICPASSRVGDTIIAPTCRVECQNEASDESHSRQQLFQRFKAKAWCFYLVLQQRIFKATQPFGNRNNKRQSLSRTGTCVDGHVFVAREYRYDGLLYWCRFFEFELCKEVKRGLGQGLHTVKALHTHVGCGCARDAGAPDSFHERKSCRQDGNLRLSVAVDTLCG